MSQRDIRSLFGKKAGGGDDEKTESARVLIISFLNPSHIFYFIIQELVKAHLIICLFNSCFFVLFGYK